ncbi:hypothetical protein SESBI_07471 [Sesbania bispinosa]|nr:hypothetical protein SESBI_07471 [Sesbania bispinosa]
MVFPEFVLTVEKLGIFKKKVPRVGFRPNVLGFYCRNGFLCHFFPYGLFCDSAKVALQGGEVHVFHGLDIDTWSYFEAVGLLIDLGYMDKVKMSWKEKGASFNTLKPLSVDEDAMELSAHVVLRKCEVEIYVEHSVRFTENVHKVPLLLPISGNVVGDVTNPEIVEKVQEAVGVTIGEEAILQNDVEKDSDIHESSDESLKNVHFDDNEKERDLGLYDGFGVGEVA